MHLKVSDLADNPFSIEGEPYRRHRRQHIGAAYRGDLTKEYFLQCLYRICGYLCGVTVIVDLVVDKKILLALAIHSPFLSRLSDSPCAEFLQFIEIGIVGHLCHGRANRRAYQ